MIFHIIFYKLAKLERFLPFIFLWRFLIEFGDFCRKLPWEIDGKKNKKQKAKFWQIFWHLEFLTVFLRNLQNWGSTRFISGSSRSFWSQGWQAGGWQQRRKNGATRTHRSGKAKISLLYCLDTNSIFNVRKNRQNEAKSKEHCILTGKITSVCHIFPLSLLQFCRNYHVIF